MPFNGSGTFTRLMNWTADAAAGIKIRADRHDAEDADQAAGLSNVICRDGQSTITANIDWNGKRITNLGDPLADQDAVTRGYLKNQPLTISGNDTQGRLTFSGSQTDPTIASAAPIGIAFTQADYFAGVRRALTASGIERSAMFFFNDTANPTSPDTDEVQIDSQGLHLQFAIGRLLFNTYYGGVGGNAKWRAQSAGFGSMFTFDRSTGNLTYWTAPATVAKDADIAPVSRITIGPAGNLTSTANIQAVDLTATGNIQGVNITSTAHHYSLQNFVATSANVVLAPTGGGGAIYLRPTDVSTTSNQTYIDGSGNLVTSGYIQSGGGTYAGAGGSGYVYASRMYGYGGALIIGPSSSGTVWIRPASPDVTTGQCYWNTNGMVQGGPAFKPGGGVWADSSDIRVKDVHGPYAHGLAEICALTPVRYSFKGNDSGHQGTDTAKEYIGLIAQETETVMPEMVTQADGEIDGEPVTDMRYLDTTPLVFALINAVKDLAGRTEALEARQ